MATIESWWSIVLEAAYRYFSELANNSCNDLSSNLYKHDPYFPKLRNFAQWIACNYDENVDIRYGLNMIHVQCKAISPALYKIQVKRNASWILCHAACLAVSRHLYIYILIYFSCIKLDHVNFFSWWNLI